MGVYGSKDTGNLYTEKKFKKEKEPFRPNKLIWAILIIDTIILLLVGFNKENILGALALDSIILFIYGFVMLVYKVFKKENVSAYATIMGIAIVMFFVSGLNLADNPSAPKINNVDVNDTSNSNTQSLGSRKNPAKMGEIIQAEVTDYNEARCLIEIEMLEFKRGEEAEIVIKDGGNSADSLGEGKEFALVKFRVKNLEDKSKKDIPFNLMSSEFAYSTGDYKVVNEQMYVYGLDPDIRADLYEGAEHEGWVCFSIEKDDTAPKVLFLKELWFDLEAPM